MRLAQPRQSVRSSPRTGASPAAAPAFVSADDYDVTGILTGMDCCESGYWWAAELRGQGGRTPSECGSGGSQARGPSQAAARSAAPATAAA